MGGVQVVLDAAEAINVLDGPAAEGAWTVGDRRFDVTPVDAMVAWRGRGVAALSANLGDDGRALLHLEGATLETPPEEAWLERCEGSTVSPPSRVALASARGFRGQTEDLLAFYDAALHAMDPESGMLDFQVKAKFFAIPNEEGEKPAI